MNKNNVILADLFEWLESYDGPRFQAVLSDPPYALISIAKRFGKAGSALAKEYEDGRFTRLSGGFMGQKWDGFDSLEHYQSWVSEWAKLLIEKVLHPGAVCLFFGGTRTYHHLGVGLERGGFEIVDCIMWLHGQGFPKSHDISKGLDKAAGAERRVIGIQDPSNPRTAMARGSTFSGFDDSEKSSGIRITEPSTPEAEQWQGYGTALKPAWEPIFLCRAPRGDKTFAQLAVEFGTGALNIDGARLAGITHGSGASMGNEIYGEFKDERKGVPNEIRTEGRWPANLILSHNDECIKVGEYEIEGRIINRFEQGMMPFGNAEGEEYESEQMPPETVERWACVPGCAVRALDDSTLGKYHASGQIEKRRYENGQGLMGYSPKGVSKSYGYDGANPSRFFYTAKASRSEKDKGVEDFHWKRTDEGFERITAEEYATLPRRERARGCIHPTVKPLDILRHLATMILPPESDEPRRILIPFSGSGSEMIGAAQAGWEQVTGIEFEEQYVEIAKARIRGTLGLFAGEIE